MSRAFAVALIALAFPTATQAATLTTDRQCYVDADGQVMNVTGADFAAGAAWAVNGAGIDEAGTTDGAGAFGFNTAVPTIGGGIKPRQFTISATQDGAPAADTTFKVVNFLAMPASIQGRPTSSTSWGFSGFTPAKPIFVHVRRSGKVYTEKAGKGDRVCGTLQTRMRRLPAVPPDRIGYGKYQVYVDNRRKFRRGGLQYFATITIFRRSN